MKKLTVDLLKKNDFYISIVGEYYNCVFSIESEDKNIETDVVFLINIENPEDIQMKIHKIDKTIKSNYKSKTVLDTPVTSIIQVKMFMKAFKIENNFNF